MRVVIDTNRLRSSELMAFLDLSPNNRAVLTDYVAMEAYQPAGNGNVIGDMMILSSFPKRVIVLKGTEVVATLDPVVNMMPSAMIDREQTRGFPTFAKAMAAAFAGDASVLAQIDERRGWAKEQLGDMLRAATETDRAFANARGLFTDTQWDAYKRNEPLPPDVVRGVLQLATDEAQTMAAFHYARPKLPTLPAHMMNHFIWRLMLCRVLRVMRQVSHGTQTQSPRKFRNDMVDAFIAAYATYFGGLMTTDQNAFETHSVARTVLKSLGAKIASDYCDGTQAKVADRIDRVRRAAGKEPIERVGRHSA